MAGPPPLHAPRRFTLRANAPARRARSVCSRTIEPAATEVTIKLIQRGDAPEVSVRYVGWIDADPSLFKDIQQAASVLTEATGAEPPMWSLVAAAAPIDDALEAARVRLGAEVKDALAAGLTPEQVAETVRAANGRMTDDPLA